MLHGQKKEQTIMGYRGKINLEQEAADHPFCSGVIQFVPKQFTVDKHKLKTTSEKPEQSNKDKDVASKTS
jgi:hypothetical protein